MTDRVFQDALTVRYYARPNRRMRELDITNTYPEDVRFFIEMDIQVSMEEFSTGQFVVYACLRDDESEESEVMVFDNGRSCQETVKALREECEKEFL